MAVRLPMLVFALLLLGGCGPKVVYDPAAGVLTRDDGAFSIPLSVRDRVAWQVEVPGVAGAPKRYPFPYECVLYRFHSGAAGFVAPSVVLVVSLHEYPDAVRSAPTFVDRNERLMAFLRSWLRGHGFARLAESDEQFVFDGRTLVTSVVDAEQDLAEPAVGAAFLFGADHVFQLVYEMYPRGASDPLPRSEVQALLRAVGELVASTSVQ